MHRNNLYKEVGKLPSGQQKKGLEILDILTKINLRWRGGPFLIWFIIMSVSLAPAMMIMVDIPVSIPIIIVSYFILSWLIIVPLSKRLMIKKVDSLLQELNKITHTTDGKKAFEKIKEWTPYFAKAVNTAKKRKIHHWLLAL